jgi:lambda family phage portal protein
MTSLILKRWLQQQPGGYQAAATRAGIVPAITKVVPLQGGQQRNYAAAQVNRLTQGWTTTSGSANSDVHAALDTLRARSRQLGRDNSYVKRYLGLVATNIIGSTGFGMQARVYDTNGKPDAGANGAIEQAWAKWSARGMCEVTGRSSLRDVSRQAILAAARDGEFLLRIVRGTSAANPFQIALQLLDIDRLDTSLNRPAEAGRAAIRMGIEHNEFGRPTRYWLRKRHPGESHAMGADVTQDSHLGIPAQDIIHGFIADRPEQLRGVPWLHAAMLEINDLGGYKEAAIVASRVGASKMGFFTTPDGDVKTLADEQADASDPDGDLYLDADAGSFGKLPPGYGFTPFNPDYPAAMFADFVKANLRGISSGLGVAYHALANDLEGVSFSSIRSGTLEERDQWMMLQEWFIEAFFEPVFAEWLRSALSFGQITLQNGSALPTSKLDKFSGHVFKGRRWEWVDPLRDVQADAEAVRNRFKSPQEVASKMGLDYEDLLAQLKQAEEMQAAAGLQPIQAAPMPGQQSGGAENKPTA